MTIQEYLSEMHFPLTSQPGLSLEKQVQLDSANFDEYIKAKRNHEPMNEHERAVGYELEAKHAARANVLQQARGGDQDEAPQGPDGSPLM